MTHAFFGFAALALLTLAVVCGAWFGARLRWRNATYVVFLLSWIHALESASGPRSTAILAVLGLLVGSSLVREMSTARKIRYAKGNVTLD